MSRAVGGTTAVLRAGITEVGKLTLSGGVGTLTSQYVAGQTGSELLGNLAGGFAGGLTYGGLNTLDTRINVSGLHPSTSVKPIKTVGEQSGNHEADGLDDIENFYDDLFDNQRDVNPDYEDFLKDLSETSQIPDEELKGGNATKGAGGANGTKYSPVNPGPLKEEACSPRWIWH